VVSRSRPAIRGRVAPPGYQEGAGGAGLNHANGHVQHLLPGQPRRAAAEAQVHRHRGLPAGQNSDREEFLAAVTGNAASAEGADDVVSARLETG